MSKTKRRFSFLVQHDTGKKIKLGGLRRSKTPPPNARKYQANIYTEDELPTKIDLRHFMTKVEDQSQTNSCVANALAGAYEYLAKRQLGDAGDVSRLFIYYNARALMGWEHKDQGSTITGAIQTLEEFGACTEETWPYDLELVNERPPEEAYDEASNFLIEEADQVRIDLRVMKHCLAEGFPFVFGLKLFNSFDKARKTGRVLLPNAQEISREEHGSHAMLCVGYSDKIKSFIVRNSWGEDWGDRGYCYIPYEYLANSKYCFDCWAIRNVTDLDFSADVWYEDDENEYEDYEEGEDEDYDYEYEDYDEDDDEDYDDEDDDEDYDDEDDDEDYDDEDDDEDYDDEDYDEDDDEDYDDEDYDEDDEDEDYDDEEE